MISVFSTSTAVERMESSNQICCAKQKMSEIGDELVQTFELIKELQTENEVCISKLKELNDAQIFEKQKLIDREIDFTKIKVEKIERDKKAALKQIEVLRSEKQKHYATFKKTTTLPKRVALMVEDLNRKIRDKYLKIENEYDIELANLKKEVERLIATKSDPENLPQIQDIDDYEKMVTYVSQLDETIQSNNDNISEITENIPRNMVGRELQEFQRQQHMAKIQSVTKKINQKIKDEKKKRAEHLKIKRNFQKQKLEFEKINTHIKTVEDKTVENKQKINDSIETVRMLFGDAVDALTTFGLGLIAITYENENWDDIETSTPPVDDWDAEDYNLDAALGVLNNIKKSINIISAQNNDSILTLVSSNQINVNNMSQLLEGPTMLMLR